MNGSDTRLERTLSGLLRTGVAASSVSLAAGLVLALFAFPEAGRWLLNAGVILLLATPVLRVAISAVTYALHRDWLFASLVSVVLLELLAGLVAAFQAYRP